MADNTQTAKIWQEAAAETKDCLPLETLEQMMDNSSRDAKAQAHLSGCAHCQTELAMLKNFEQSTPSADEGAAVAWIAAQLERQQNAPAAQQKVARVPFWRAMFRIPYIAGAAALAAVLIFGISLYHGNSDGPGRLNPGVGNSPFRTGAIHLLSPVGNLTERPEEFRWEPFSGANSYTIELRDIAGVVLASAKSNQNVLAATPAMKAQMSSGKPLQWKVTALDGSGNEIAVSSGGNFKIK